MTRKEKASLLLEWFINLAFEDGVETSWFNSYIDDRKIIFDTIDENTQKWTSAYIDLYNLKQSILEYESNKVNDK